MVVDFSKIDYDEKPTLILRNLDGTPIQTLGYAFNIKATFEYNEISEITFDLPRQADGVKTPHYDDVVGRRIIDFHNIGQFILFNPVEKSDGIRTIKSCTAYSLEYEFLSKTMTLEKNTYKFYDAFDPSDTILGRIMEEMPDWRIGHIDDDIITKYRTFDATEDKVYTIIKNSVQKSYECIFEFDTYNREVSVISASKSTEPKAVYLSSERLIKEINIEEDSQKIVTCLDVQGAEGVNIRSVNPTGTNKIYNLDYFMNTTNFSEEFIQKWRNWEADYNAQQEPYYRISLERDIKTELRVGEETKLAELNGDLTTLENKRAAAVSAVAKNSTDAKKTLADVNGEIEAKTEEIQLQEEYLNEIKNSITNLEAKLKEISNSLAFEKYFTREELTVLNRYFIEDSIQNSSFTVSHVGTYNNDASNSIIPDHSTLIVKPIQSDTPCKIETVEDNAGSQKKIFKTISEGQIHIRNALFARIVKATIELQPGASGLGNSGGAFVMTARLGNGDNDGDPDNGGLSFEKGNITLTGRYSKLIEESSGDENSVTKDLSLLSFDLTSCTMYFTKNMSSYEQRTVEWELYDYGKNVLYKSASPNHRFSVESGNFLALEDFISFKNALTLGRRAYLRLDDKDVMTPYVVCVKINFEDCSDFALGFSDTYTSFDEEFQLIDILQEGVSMGKTLNLKGDVYEEFVNSGASNKVKEFMDSALDLAKNKVLSSGHQAIDFGDAGLRLRQYMIDKYGNATSELDPKQIWAVNNMIAFTEDNWETSCMAIGEIFNESGGDYVKVSENAEYDSNKNYYYIATDSDGSNKVNAGGTPIYRPYTYNDTTFEKDRTNLYYKTGSLKYGIAAPYLVGSIIAGKNLLIGTDDGCFKVDDSGVYVLNEKFVIGSSNGNGLSFTADNGLVHKVTGSDGTKYEAGFSARSYTDDSGNVHFGLYYKVGGKDKLFYDTTESQLVVDGDVWCRKLWLGEKKKDILTYINGDGIKTTPKVNGDKNAIDGRHISCAGLSINGSNGSFNIDSDGRVTMNDSYITMTKIKTSDSGTITHTIRLDPDSGLLFKKGEDVAVNLNINDGSATFTGDIRGSNIYGSAITSGSTIDVTTDVKVGETIVVRDSNGGDGLVISAKGGSLREAISITANYGRYIDITSNLVRINGEKVITQGDLNDRLSDLKTEIENWVSSNFAAKGSTNPTIPVV